MTNNTILNTSINHQTKVLLHCVVRQTPPLPPGLTSREPHETKLKWPIAIIINTSINAALGAAQQTPPLPGLNIRGTPWNQVEMTNSNMSGGWYWYRILLLVISTWFEVVPPMFNPGEGRCLPGPMQQNFCLAVDTCINNLLVISTWFHFLSKTLWNFNFRFQPEVMVTRVIHFVKLRKLRKTKTNFEIRSL